MAEKATSPADYLANVSEDRKPAFEKLMKTVQINIDNDFESGMSYGMPGWFVPHSKFPDGYHCDPKLPLPFASVANQKNFIALYHMGLYATPELHKWFVDEYPKHCKYKLDMGKSCIRFKKVEDIPYELIGELFKKMNANQWIDIYKKNVRS